MVKSITGQLQAIWTVTFSPRKGLLALPSDRLWPTAFLISAYFTVARLERQGTLNTLESSLGSPWTAFAAILFLSFLAFCVVGACLHVFIRLVGKKISLRKVLNIMGYSQAPRLFLSIPASIIFAILPSETRSGLLTSLGGVTGIALSCIGLPVLLYSLFLAVWGFVLSPDERRVPTGQDSAA